MLKLLASEVKMNWNKFFKVFSSLVLAFSVLFLGYIFFSNDTDIYHKRNLNRLEEYKNMKYDVSNDEKAPIKVKRTFTTTIDDTFVQDDYLAFYVPQSYVNVYIDSNLIYQVNNNETKSVGNNYVLIPITENVVGKELKVEIYPVYKFFADRDITFYKGPLENIYNKEIGNNILELLLGSVCVLLGFILCCLSIYLLLSKNYKGKLSYLGVFVLSIGLWKICDMRCTSLLFPNYSTIISYISLTMLYVAPLCFLASIYTELDSRGFNLIKLALGIAISLPMIVMIMDLTGILDMRNSLVLCHIALVFYLIVLVYYCIKNYIINKKVSSASWLVLALVLGVASDLITYYINDSSSNTIFLLVAIIISVMISTINVIKELESKSVIDTLTGLNNNNACKEKLENEDILAKDIGLIVFDINGLKEVNDTYGHACGDEFIKDFANILRKCMVKNSFIGRFGGDEFIVILYSCSEKKIKDFLLDVKEKTKRINKELHNTKLSYSCGYALSTTENSITMKELFNTADERMYNEKKAYHKKYDSIKKTDN